MNLFSLYAQLSFSEQFYHGLHLALCAFAILIALIPLCATKGSPEHKFAGRIYIPVSFFALFVGTILAWREASLVLFTFNAFCVYLLLSGWRAVHEGQKPQAIDWAIPSFLTVTAIAVSVRAILEDDGVRAFYLLFFACNAFYLAYRDLSHLSRRKEIFRSRIFFVSSQFGSMASVNWLNRHVAGMIGSLLANVSVVVLTLLPFELHILWPIALIVAGIYINVKERTKKARRHVARDPVVQFPSRTSIFRSDKPRDPPFRRAA